MNEGKTRPYNSSRGNELVRARTMWAFPSPALEGTSGDRNLVRARFPDRSLPNPDTLLGYAPGASRPFCGGSERSRFSVGSQR